MSPHHFVGLFHWRGVLRTSTTCPDLFRIEDLSLSLSIATREIQNRRYSKKFYDNNIFYDNIMIMVISE
jgi:hypothetical protein